MRVIKIVNRILEKIKKPFEPELAIFQRKEAVFITIDGVEHYNSKFNYLKVSSLLRTYEDYIMISIESDGYIKDNDGIMYPLNNVLSIEWKNIKEMLKADEFQRYQVWFDKEEVDQMKDWGI